MQNIANANDAANNAANTGPWKCNKCDGDHRASHTRRYICNLSRDAAVKWRKKNTATTANTATPRRQNAYGINGAIANPTPPPLPPAGNAKTRKHHSKRRRRSNGPAKAAAVTTGPKADDDDSDTGDESDAEIKSIRERLNVTNAKLASLMPFHTDEAKAEKDQLQEHATAVTLRKPIEDRVEIYSRALSDRRAKAQTAYDKMVDVEKAVEKAMAAADDAADKHKQAIVAQAEMEQLHDAAKAELKAANKQPPSATRTVRQRLKGSSNCFRVSWQPPRPSKRHLPHSLRGRLNS